MNVAQVVPALFGLIVSMIAYTVVYYALAMAGVKTGYTKVLQAS